jgi:hypothetical protein
MAQELEQDRHTPDLGEDLEVGHDPFGDADPGACGADASECEIAPHVLDGPPERSEVPVVEEAVEPYVGESTVFGVSPEDGLPVPLNEGPELHEAPPLRYDNFVCVEDARSYVEIFAGEGTALYPATASSPSRFDSVQKVIDLISYAPRSEFDQKGAPRERLTFEPSAVQTAFGIAYAKVREGAYVFVRPVRPRCEHLRRQVLSQDGVNEGEKCHFLIFRNCAVRRSVGGALMSLRDQAVYACDYRSPPDPGSVKTHLDDPEKRTLERPPTRLPMFQGPPVPLPDVEGRN